LCEQDPRDEFPEPLQPFQEMAADLLGPSASAPLLVTLTRSIVEVWRSHTKTSLVKLVYRSTEYERQERAFRPNEAGGNAQEARDQAAILVPRRADVGILPRMLDIGLAGG